MADIYGNLLQNTDIPLVDGNITGSGNISDNQDIEIDNLILSPIPPVVGGKSTIDVGMRVAIARYRLVRPCKSPSMTQFLLVVRR